MYWRRLWSPLPAGWREQLRHPRMRGALFANISIWLTCGLFALRYLVEFSEYEPLTHSLVVGDFDQLLGFASLTGYFLLYYTAADLMPPLAWQDAADSPEWYATPLPSGRALFGTLLAALLGTLPLVLAVLLNVSLSSISTEAWVANPRLLGLLPEHLIRLPAYMLMAVSLCLLLRRFRWRRLVPLLLAVGAVLQLWPGLQEYDPSDYPWRLASGLLLLGSGAGLALVATWLLVRCVNTRVSAGAAGMAAALVLGMPFLPYLLPPATVVLCALQQQPVGSLSVMLPLGDGISFHYAAAFLFPVPAPKLAFAYNWLFSYDNFQRPVLLLRLAADLAIAGLATGLWWWTAVASLDTARHRFRPVRRAAPGSRRALQPAHFR
jgi:hypothetical protein